MISSQRSEMGIAEGETSLAVKEEDRPLLYIYMDIDISAAGN
jgi:hypothetical protein